MHCDKCEKRWAKNGLSEINNVDKDPYAVDLCINETLKAAVVFNHLKNLQMQKVLSYSLKDYDIIPFYVCDDKY